MQPIRNFDELTAHLRALKNRKRIAVVCANDPNTEYAIARALEEGIAEFLMIGDSAILKKYPTLKRYPGYVKAVHVDDPDEAARLAVRMVRQGEADILMKGIINTDNLLQAILDKEHGLLPRGKVLTHLAVMQIPAYHKLLFFSDPAVIPSPTLEQRKAIIRYAIATARKFGIERPKVALIHATEKANPKIHYMQDYLDVMQCWRQGEFGDVIMDGPMDVFLALDRERGSIKHVPTPVLGDADVLIFPSFESANSFYKGLMIFAGAEMGGLLQGTSKPVVLTSRSESIQSKFYSIAMGCVLC